MPLSRAEIRESMAQLARELDIAPHGQRESLIAVYCAGFGVSRQTVYRQLHAVGWTSGRKARSDKGTTSAPAEYLAEIGALKRVGVRQNGKHTMNTSTAISILAQNQGGIAPLSPSRVNAALRQRGLDVATQSLASAHVSMKSKHPNHVHQVDASLCLVYYLNGRQGVIRDDQLYKNKLDALARVKYRVYRWVLTDHTSSYIVPWYTEARGEDQLSLAEFLFFAWGQQEGRDFHGVPRVVMWDKGAAQRAYAVKSLLRSLGVQDIAHATGNSRAKGQVEGAQNIVEEQFESRLRLEPVDNVAQLNEAAFAWAKAYNSNSIPHQDTRVHRGPVHLARADLWNRIKVDQMRYLPDVELCRALLAGKEETRKVMGRLEIQFRHPGSPVALRYSVSGLEGVSVGDELVVQPLLYGDCELLVTRALYDGTKLEYTLTPIRDYDEFGFRESAPIIGEAFKSHAETRVEASGKALDRMAYPDRPLEEIAKAKQKNEAPFDGLIDAHSHLGKVDVRQYLPRRGSEISVPDRVSIDVSPVLTRLDALKALKVLLGRDLGHEENRNVGLWYPEGVPEDQLPLVATALRTKTTPFRNLGKKEASA